eukprot:TRINITY_DN81624_c0_g1_i1.p1 TRINITY_DN81624_c0_g1~~TRINITY_DN81624_c0_g1_i1.p1  ORF type:complete len:363 (+),score=66.08 TRINITY_DN81624_c0_g1_i1:70-1089(+)
MGRAARLACAALVLLGSGFKQCKNPLFETHWAGKNDIQTLTDFPVVKTNLNLCPHYNQKASCCRQTFESEQLKFFNFWEQAFQDKLLRLEANRQAVIAAAGYLDPQQESFKTDYQQFQAVLQRYHDLLQGKEKSKCLSMLLTYVAGVICFSCKPNWFHYTVLEGDSDAMVDQVIRVRMTTSVCLDVWAMCKHFSQQAVALDLALRDSSVARNASVATEDLDLFKGKQTLCDWMHDQVALHPFEMRMKEDSNLPTPPPSVNSSWLRNASTVARLLQTHIASTDVKSELDPVEDGRKSGFDLSWHDPPQISHSARPAACMALLAGFWLLLQANILSMLSLP